MTRKYNLQNITIRCLTKPQFGLGHFRRCLTLAQDFKRRKYKIHFIIDPNDFAENELISNKISFTLVPNFSKNMMNIKKVLDIMQFQISNVLIIDLRQFSEKFSKSIWNKNIQTILIDDAWTKTAYTDLIFNGSNVKNYHKYKKINKNCKIFTGTKYFIMDQKFSNFRKKINQINNKTIPTVVISTGGTDPNNISKQVLNSVLSIPKIKFKIIVGPHYEKIYEIKKISKKTNIEIIKSPKKLWEEFYFADVVITNSGSTLFELASQNIPTLMIAADEHQIPYAKQFSKDGFGIFLGFWKTLSSSKIKQELQSLLFDKQKRIKISKHGKYLVDGCGTSRIILEIESFLNLNPSNK